MATINRKSGNNGNNGNNEGTKVVDITAVKRKSVPTKATIKQSVSEEKDFQDFLDTIPASTGEPIIAGEENMTNEQDIAELDKIRKEMLVEDAAHTLSAAARHRDRKEISLFYEPIPEDVVIEIDGIGEIKVTPMITYEEVLDAIQWVISIAADGRKFISTSVADIVEAMAVVKFYTDLNVAEDGVELLDQFDILMRRGIIDEIYANIDTIQLNWFLTHCDKTMENIIEYQNSAAGIIEQIGETANGDNAGIFNVMKTLEDNADLLQKYEDIYKLVK